MPPSSLESSYDLGSADDLMRFAHHLGRVGVVGAPDGEREPRARPRSPSRSVAPTEAWRESNATAC